VTRYAVAYFGQPIRGPFDSATEAAIVSILLPVGNPEGLEVVPVPDDFRPTPSVTLSTPRNPEPLQ